MPWYGFTFHGVPDLPDIPLSSVTTGHIFLYPSSGAYDNTLMTYVTGTPDGFLRCDGSLVPTATYSDLFNYFADPSVFNNGYYFGGAGANFALPSMAGRWVVGQDPGGDPDFDFIADFGGAVAHSHTVADGAHVHPTPDHTHTSGNHRHTYNNHQHTAPIHDHGLGTLAVTASNASNPLYVGNNNVTWAAAGHSHNVSGSSDSAAGLVSFPRTTANAAAQRDNTDYAAVPTTSPITDTAGAPSAATTLNSTGNDNIPPYQSFHYIIKV